MKILNKSSINLSFAWLDPEHRILFSQSLKNGRFDKLWQKTCFEAFIKQKNSPKYFEINISNTRAWNVYEFQSYRAPQPPSPFNGVEKINFNQTNNQISADIFFSGVDFTQVNASLCAVLVLKDGRTTFWSTKHVDSQPNFHHQDSFSLERKIK